MLARLNAKYSRKNESFLFLEANVDLYEITMSEQKFLQNGVKTSIEPEKKSEGVATKEKDDEKEGDNISLREELQKGQRKRARISEVEKLQIAGGSQVSPTKLRAAAGEQKRPRTKIAQHKPSKGNIGTGKMAEAVDSRRQHEGGTSKNVNILTELLPSLLLSVLNHGLHACIIRKILIHMFFTSVGNHRDRGIALHILSIGCYGDSGIWGG
jgi:hypothetical protein